MSETAFADPKEDLAGLAQRAGELESVLEDHLLDPNGVVLAAVDIDTLRPHTKEMFPPGTDMMRHPAMQAENFGDYFAYENCGMCTGSHLAAMVWKYRATGDTAALDHARRSFLAIDHIYRVSQQIEPGFFCKYHEAQPTTEMSTDQCMYAITGMDAYAAHATGSERSRIQEIIGGIASMWMRKGYRHPYRDRNFEWQWPLNRFPVLIWHAWRHTGEARFHEEFLRLASLPEVIASPPHCPMTLRNVREQAEAHRRRHGTLENFFWGATPESAASAETALEPLVRDDAPFPELWRGQLRDALDAAMLKLDENFLERGHCRYDFESGRLIEVTKPYYLGGKPSPIWEHKSYIANAKSGHSPPMFARALVAADACFPDMRAAGTAMRILRALGLRDMVWKQDPLNHLPENQRWLTRTLSVDAVTNWLWAYWMAAAKSEDR